MPGAYSANNRLGSSLRTTIRARGHKAPQIEAGHTTTPARDAKDLFKALASEGRPHRTFCDHLVSHITVIEIADLMGKRLTDAVHLIVGLALREG